MKGEQESKSPKISKTFLARKGEAPLKVFRGRATRRPRDAFLARKGEAPLKEQIVRARRVRTAPFLARKGEAPLKGSFDDGYSDFVRVIPRPQGRGPVEGTNKLPAEPLLALHSSPARARPR